MSEPGAHGDDSTPTAGTAAATASALAQLRARGAEHWDAPGLAVVDRLLAQAAQAPVTLATHLSARAHAHLQRLQQGFRQAHERGAYAVGRLRAAEHPAQLRVQEALSRGDVFSPRRLMRLAPQARPRLRDELRKHLAEQLDAQAEARGISSPGTIEAPLAQSRSSTRPLAVAQSLYRDAAAGASARMTLAKTAASVPQDAGRYHAVQIGARTLEEAARHPAYLKAVLCRLETLGVLWHHGAVASGHKPRKAERSEPKKPEPKKPERGDGGAER